MKAFWLCFIPLFVSVDPVGILPLFLGMTRHTGRERVRAIILQSLVTALLVSLAFFLIGKAVLNVLNITIGDFMIAGGVLLFALSIGEMASPGKPEAAGEAEEVGVVPLGVPLLAGPAVFTAGMLLIDQYGFAVTASALALNILITGVLLWFASAFRRMLGDTGARIISKLAALLLASFGVMMVRKGILQFFTGH
ncbi:MAG: MarC family protein [Syntrophaceae bacterium]